MPFAPLCIAAETKDKIVQPVDESIATRQLTQQEEEKWRAEQEKLTALLENLQQENETLTAEQQALTKSVDIQSKRVEEKNRQLTEIVKMTEEIDPFVQQLFNQLESLVETSPPFLHEERHDRLERIRPVLYDSAVTVGERYRRVMEALLIEAEYGFDYEVYQQTIAPGGAPMLSTIFRLGRMNLFYLSLDEKTCGFYNVASKKVGTTRHLTSALHPTGHCHRPETPAGRYIEITPGEARNTMRYSATTILTTVFFLSLFNVLSAPAEDMRALQQEAHALRTQLETQAGQEKADAAREARKSRKRIENDKSALQAAIAELKAANTALQTDITRLEKKQEELTRDEEELDEKLESVDNMIQELVGVIRINAKDVDKIVATNIQTLDHDSQFINRVAENLQFPSMDDVRAMAEALFEQIQYTGEVSLRTETIIDREGLDSEADILFLGPYTAIYSLKEKDETGFLNYSTTGNRLYALSRLPSFAMVKNLTGYMAGKTDSIFIDISRGAGLRQLTHHLSLSEQISHGGPIIWPILAILVIGILIVLERLFFILRKKSNGRNLIARLEKLVQEKSWQECESICLSRKRKPLPRVLLAGLLARNESREDMENILQEAILKETPPLERFLSTLGMLVAIAPLLGLLGTVTGMINVFHVITLHGTGDPRLMSGGISEALVTTMLGLAVAIPLMLLHNLLSRSVDNMVGDMEEKSISLVNTIYSGRS